MAARDEPANGEDEHAPMDEENPESEPGEDDPMVDPEDCFFKYICQSGCLMGSQFFGFMTYP